MISIISFSQEDKIRELHAEIDKLGLNLPQKISLYSQILAIDSNDYEAILGQGESYYSRWKILGRIDDIYLDSALIQMNKACASESADYRAFNNRANLYYDFKEFDKAFPDFSKVIQQNPALINVRWKRASIYMKRKDYENALSDLNYALEREEPSCWMLRMRANCYANLEQYSKCKSDLNKALLINDKDNDNHLLLGDYYALIGKYKKAIKKYNFIINRIDLYSLAYLKRGNVYAAIGQFDKAKNDWQIAENRGYIVDDKAKEIRFGSSGYRLMKR